MNSKEQANHYYKAAFDRWALELSYEKNHLIAKSIAEYVVEQILNVIEVPSKDYQHWVEVKDEINKIRGYDNNIHDGDNSVNG
jgi:hypothetical protein